MEDSGCKFTFCLAKNGAVGASCYVISTCLADSGALWAARYACSRDWHALHHGVRPSRLLLACARMRAHLALSCSARLAQPAFATTCAGTYARRRHAALLTFPCCTNVCP